MYCLYSFKSQEFYTHVYFSLPQLHLGYGIRFQQVTSYTVQARATTEYKIIVMYWNKTNGLHRLFTA